MSLLVCRSPMDNVDEQAKVPRWPRLTKFILSACAASVAELGMLCNGWMLIWYTWNEILAQFLTRETKLFVCAVTFPLDLTKTRLQVQGEAAARRAGAGSTSQPSYRGMLRTAIGIVQEEGPLKLWQGVTPAIYRHVGKVIHLSKVIYWLRYR